MRSFVLFQESQITEAKRQLSANPPGLLVSPLAVAGGRHVLCSPEVVIQKEPSLQPRTGRRRGTQHGVELELPLLLQELKPPLHLWGR